MRTLLATAALLALDALPSAAGEIAIEAHVGYFDMSAQKSARALFGSSGGAIYGGGMRYSFWRGAFASFGVRSFSKDGERVFLISAGSPIQKLGFPISLNLTPFVVSAGYRFRDGALIVPYASVGAAITSYSEQSDVAGQSLDDQGSKTGFIGAAGVEVGRGLFRFGAEAGYSTVSGVVGLGGVSKIYGEDDIGGFHAIGKLIVAFGGKPKATKPQPKTAKP